MILIAVPYLTVVLGRHYLAHNSHMGHMGRPHVSKGGYQTTSRGITQRIRRGVNDQRPKGIRGA